MTYIENLHNKEKDKESLSSTIPPTYLDIVN